MLEAGQLARASRVCFALSPVLEQSAGRRSYVGRVAVDLWTNVVHFASGAWDRSDAQRRECKTIAGLGGYVRLRVASRSDRGVVPSAWSVFRSGVRSTMWSGLL